MTALQAKLPVWCKVCNRPVWENFRRASSIIQNFSADHDTRSRFGKSRPQTVWLMKYPVTLLTNIKRSLTSIQNLNPWENATDLYSVFQWNPAWNHLRITQTQYVTPNTAYHLRGGLEVGLIKAVAFLHHCSKQSYTTYIYSDQVFLQYRW